MKKALIIICSIVVVLLVAGAIYIRPMYQRFIAVEAQDYGTGLTVFIGGGGNSIMLVSADGKEALLVDPKMGPGAKKMKAAVKAERITIVNTHSHSDHAAGNILYPGAKIIAGAYTKEQWALDSENSRYPDITLRPGNEMKMRIGDETVILRNMGRAHTMNDMVVYLEKRGLLVAGDLVFMDMHPVLFGRSGSSATLWIGVLDDLRGRYDVKILVPGHGGVSDGSALAVMKDYFISMGASVGDPAKQSELKKKYSGYYSLPGMSDFDRTLAYIAKEGFGR